jgi:DNA-binding GntR family transcriptional regulator
MANLERSCAEHAAIIEAIEKNDAAKAAQILGAHWFGGIEVVAKRLVAE